MEFKIKALDELETPEEERHLYSDDRWTELYDLYDWEAGSPVPQTLLDAKVVRESEGKRRVDINYKLDSTFSLDGDIGYASGYAEAGKKAFVRDGSYEHPTKGIKSYIRWMKPMDYIMRCRDLFNSFDRGDRVPMTNEDVVESRSNYDVMWFDKSKGNIFPPTIDYGNKGQEGLHRALYAEKKGITKMPVVIIY